MEFDVIGLSNYGVLGAWTIYLLYEKKVLFKKLTAAIDRLAKKETEAV